MALKDLVEKKRKITKENAGDIIPYILFGGEALPSVVV